MWRGVEKGFAERPVGFTHKDTTKQGTPSSDGSQSPPRKKIFRASRPLVTRDYDGILGSSRDRSLDVDQEPPPYVVPTSGSDDEGNESDEHMEVDRSSTPLSLNWSFPQKTQHLPSSTSVPMPSYGKPRRHSTAKNVKANNMLIDMSHQGATIPEIVAAWKERTGLDSTEAAWRSRWWRLNAKGLTGVKESESPERDIKSCETKGIRFRAVNSQYTPGTSPYFRRPSRRLSQLSLQDTRQASELSSRESIESPALANAGAGAHSSSKIYNLPMTPLATPIESPSMVFTLAPHKLARTTLRIADSNTFTPLKLRSCSNISAVFTKVLDICSLTAHKDTVEALKLTFDWFPEGTDERTMLLKERYEDSFEFFLETVDEAPCWADGGKCTVGVEVVKAAGAEPVAMEIEEPTVEEDAAGSIAPVAVATEEHVGGKKRSFSAIA